MKFVSLLIFFILNFLFIQAQCPWNRVNCSHGCGRHFDENKDGYCDYSILELNKVNSIDTVLKNEITKSKKKDSIIIAKNKNITKPSPTKIAPESTFVSEIDTINNKISETKLTPNLNPKSTVNTPPYDLILISCITLFLYGISFMMVKFKTNEKKYSSSNLEYFATYYFFNFMFIWLLFSRAN